MHFAALAVISIHALREEGDPEPDSCDCEFVVFLSTPSARRATELHSFRQGQSEISIHALREEGDSGMRSGALNRSNFYPRPPRGGRLVSLNIKAAPDLQFLSTPSARRATMTPFGPAEDIEISIPALREEGDVDFFGG